MQSRVTASADVSAPRSIGAGLAEEPRGLGPPGLLAFRAVVGHQVVVAGDAVHGRGERVDLQPPLVETVGEVTRCGHPDRVAACGRKGRSPGGPPTPAGCAGWTGGSPRRCGRCSAPEDRPLLIDLGYGASPVTTLELYRGVRAVAPDAEVAGLEIDPQRVASAHRRLAALRAAGDELPGLLFERRRVRAARAAPPGPGPRVQRAAPVPRGRRPGRRGARLRAGLAAGGVLVEGTCDEIGRRAVWVALGPEGPRGADHLLRAGSRRSSARPTWPSGCPRR